MIERNQKVSKTCFAKLQIRSIEHLTIGQTFFAREETKMNPELIVRLHSVKFENFASAS